MQSVPNGYRLTANGVPLQGYPRVGERSIADARMVALYRIVEARCVEGEDVSLRWVQALIRDLFLGADNAI